MDVLPLLILISLAVIGLAVWIFFRMSDAGQFDEGEGPARLILMDDDRPDDDRPDDDRTRNNRPNNDRPEKDQPEEDKDRPV